MHIILIPTHISNILVIVQIFVNLLECALRKCQLECLKYEKCDKCMLCLLYTKVSPKRGGASTCVASEIY